MNLTKAHLGDLTITGKDDFTAEYYNELEEIVGYLTILEDVNIQFNNLTKVNGITIGRDSNLSVPNLLEVGEIKLEANSNISADNLKILHTLIVASNNNSELIFPNLEMAAYILINGNSFLTVPKLTKILQEIEIDGGSLNADLLSDIFSLRVLHEGKITAPKLENCNKFHTSNGGELNIPQLKDLEYKYVDSMLTIVENSKTKDDIIIEYSYTFRSIQYSLLIDKEYFYIASKDGFNAHGKTMKYAVESLIFKISQDKLKKEPITPDTIITIELYRAITGACELGVTMWMDKFNIKQDHMKAAELLPLLKEHHAYGVEQFEELLTL